MHFEQSPLSLCCFTFMIGHSLLGVLRFTHPSVSECIVKTYHITTLLAQTLPLLLVTTQLCINVRLFLKYIYIQILFALLPTIWDLSNHQRCRDFTLNGIVIINAVLLLYTGVHTEKFWSPGLAILSVLNHFSLKHICSWYSVPRTDLYIVGLAFFTVFAVNCLNEWNNRVNAQVNNNDATKASLKLDPKIVCINYNLNFNLYLYEIFVTFVNCIYSYLHNM